MRFLFIVTEVLVQALSHFGGPRSALSSTSKICILRLFFNTRPPYLYDLMSFEPLNKPAVSLRGFLRRHVHTFG